MLGLGCCVGFSVVAVNSCSLVSVCGLLITVTSLVIEHGLWSTWTSVAVVGLSSFASRALGHGLSCSTACGIFLDQGSDLCPLHWQADSLTTGPGMSLHIFLISRENVCFFPGGCEAK